jgi:hypothetical protein
LIMRLGAGWKSLVRSDVKLWAGKVWEVSAFDPVLRLGDVLCLLTAQLGGGRGPGI